MGNMGHVDFRINVNSEGMETGLRSQVGGR